MSANKVQFNLKKVHYAILTTTVGTGGVITNTFGTPVHVPGAVSLSLEARGEVTPFYADGITYYQSIANNGYEGDLEMAKIPDAMLEDVWGLTAGTTSKVLTENAAVEPKPFALLFQIDGDADEEYYVVYNCMGTRPAISSETNTDTKEPKTQTSSITASALSDGKVMARTTADSPSATKSGWFSSVFVEGS